MRHALTCLALCVARAAALPSYAAAAPPEISVTRPTQREITDEEHFTGRTEASTTVEVRSRLASYLQKVLFKDGAEVKKGDLLFQLDDRPYRAELEKAQAVVSREEARLKLADADFTRGKKLRETGAISVEELNKLTAALEEARAALQAARAALELAKLDLERTRVTAPISGKIGRSLLDAGNVVSKDSALATIVVLDPLHVYFDVDERTLLRLRRLLSDSVAKDRKVVTQVRTATDEDSPRHAVIDFSDTRVDPATGTLRVRAVMPNPKAELLPGMFVTVNVPLSAPRKVLLIPSGAIARQDGKDHILVVNGKNILEARPVKVGPLVSGLQVIEEGVGPGDWVVAAGPRDVKAGDEVKPRQEKTPPARPLGVTAPGASGQTPLPRGLEIRLLPGFAHERLKGDDHAVGTITKKDGLQIYYLMGRIRQGGVPVSGDFVNQALQLPEKDRLWLKEQSAGGRQVHVAYSKDHRLIISSASATEGVNFTATAESPGEVADMLLMILTLVEQKPKRDK